MPVFKFSKPFSRSMNSEPITETDLDFNKLTAKDYIKSFSNVDVNEIDLVAYGKLGFQQARNLIASAIDCIPDMLYDMSIIDYKQLEKACFAWFLHIEVKPEQIIDFENEMTVKDYLTIRSRNALRDGELLSTKASPKTRQDIISFVTKKKIEELEVLPIVEYIPLDIQCASFFSELI